jgi:hypothetical protein
MNEHTRDTYIALFITALFTVTKLCPSGNERIKKKWYIYIMEYYSAIESVKLLGFQQNGWNWRS